MDNWKALPAFSFWAVSSCLVCALPSLGIFKYRGEVRIRSSLWREYQIFLDMLRLKVGNVWQAVGNEGWKLGREVKAGGRNMAVVSLRLIFEAMGEKSRSLREKTGKARPTPWGTSGLREWEKAAKELEENQNGVNGLHWRRVCKQSAQSTVSEAAEQEETWSCYWIWQ